MSAKANKNEEIPIPNKANLIFLNSVNPLKLLHSQKYKQKRPNNPKAMMLNQ